MVLVGGLAVASLATAPAKPGSAAPGAPQPVRLASLEPPEAAEPRLPVSSVLMFSAFSPIAAARLTGPSPGDLASADAARNLQDLVRRDAASRDPTLSTVLPPSRPAFIELRPTSRGSEPEARFQEVRAAAPEPASSASAPSAGFWPWPVPSAARPEPTRPERPLQAGVASWYGPGFHGRRTASGEIFNQNAMTAAHRSLPFGTKVKVVDERTGRSVVVRINDRGPFKRGRVIDLSKASAAALGIGGLGRVRIVAASE